MASSDFRDASIPGGVVHNPASSYAREMAKWEMGYSPYGPPGRPRETVGHQAYPAACYRMSRSKTNGDFVIESFILAESPEHKARLEAQGYREGRAAAQAHVEELEQAVARAAAERAYADRNLGEKAKAEAAKIEDATSGHVGEIPATPVKPRGRPKKMAAPTA
jgi:hypothetical protein